MTNRIKQHLPAGHNGAVASDAAPPAPPAGPLPLLWSIGQTAAALGVSVPTVKHMAACGELPPGAVVRLGRRRLFSKLVIERWCADGCPRPRSRSGA
jgi:hypothetical protein